MHTKNNSLKDAAVDTRDFVAHQQPVSSALAAGDTLPGELMANPKQAPNQAAKFRGRFALLPQRNETITVQHVRALMAREGL
jgi:hypothetical protein